MYFRGVEEVPLGSGVGLGGDDDDGLAPGVLGT